MVTVCPLLAVTVAVATVTTVCPAGMAVTRLACPVLVTTAGAVLVMLVVLVEVTPGSPSTESTNRRRRAAPVGGELYRSSRVVGEGDTPAGGGGRLFYIQTRYMKNKEVKK